MLERPTSAIAFFAALACLVLAGCGRELPAAAVYAASDFAAAAATNGAPGAGETDNSTSLAGLMHQALTIIRQQYPKAQLYVVRGTRTGAKLVDTSDFGNWTFGCVDDASAPQSTVYVHFANGQFSQPAVKAGTEPEKLLEPLAAKLSLRESIAALHQAGFNQDFHFADLFAVISPRFKEPFYVFSAETVIVTVGAKDGAISQFRPDDWYGRHEQNNAPIWPFGAID